MPCARRKRSSASGPPWQRRRLAAQLRRRRPVDAGGDRTESTGARVVCARPMPDDPTLAQRLLDGDKRALARAITLVEDDDPAGWELVREVYPHTGKAAIVGLTGAPGVGQVDADRRADQAAPRGRPRGRGAVDRPVVAVHPRRAARRPHPADRALPRPGRLHPLDGQPRRARRAQRGGAAGGAADGRRGQGRRLPRDGRRRPGRGRHHRPRRHDRAGAHAGLRRLDPGPEGRDHGDPRHHRRQQGRPPADRHHGPRDPRRAVAGAAARLARADRQDPGRARRRRRELVERARRAPRVHRARGDAVRAPPAQPAQRGPRAVRDAPAPQRSRSAWPRTTTSRGCSTRWWRGGWIRPRRRARSSSASTRARLPELRPCPSRPPLSAPRSAAPPGAAPPPPGRRPARR